SAILLSSPVRPPLEIVKTRSRSSLATAASSWAWVMNAEEDVIDVAEAWAAGVLVDEGQLHASAEPLPGLAGELLLLVGRQPADGDAPGAGLGPANSGPGRPPQGLWAEQPVEPLGDGAGAALDHLPKLGRQREPPADEPVQLAGGVHR